MSPTEQLDAAIRKIERDIADAQAERAPLEQALTGDEQADAQIHAELDQLEGEIAGQQKRIARLQALRAKATFDASAEAVAAQRERAKAAAQRAAHAAVARVELAKQIDLAFSKVGELLAEWDQAGADIHADLHQAISTAHADSPNERHVEQEISNISSAARGSDVAAFACAVGKLEGDNRRGGDFVDVRKPLGSSVSYESAAEFCADRVAGRASALHAKISKKA